MLPLPIRKFEILANRKPNIFLKELDDFSKSHTWKDVSRLLKSSGIVVDPYRTTRYSKLCKEALDFLLARYPQDKDKTESLIREKLLFEKLFTLLDDEKRQLGLERIHKNNRAPAFIVATEVLLSSMKEFGNGIPPSSIQERYPFFVLTLDKSDNVVPADKVAAHLTLQIESTAMNTGGIYQYLIYQDSHPGRLNKETPLQDVRLSREHFSLFNKWKSLKWILECWKFIDCSFKTADDQNVLFEPIDKERYENVIIANDRYYLMYLGFIYDLQGRKQNFPFSKAPPLPPKSFYSEIECLGAVSSSEIFASDHLEETFDDVSLSEWLRTYSIIADEAQKFLQTRAGIKEFSIRAACLNFRYKELCRLLESGGIRSSSLERIIKRLTFNEVSKDFLDCPLLQIEDRFVILPSIATIINPGRSIISNFVNLDIDISSRGPGLEKYVRRIINKAGFRFVDLEFSDGSDLYQCDGVFQIEDFLFFIEVKAYLQPSMFREYFLHEVKVIEAATQLNRIAEFFTRKLELIRDQLALSVDWRPRSVIKMIITSSIVGHPSKVNDCELIDTSTLGRFLARIPIGIKSGDKILTERDSIYEGDITLAKFLELIRMPPPIKAVRMQHKETIEELEIGKVKLHAKALSRALPEFFFIDERSEQKIFESATS
jgi:hypothetical protein